MEKATINSRLIRENLSVRTVILLGPLIEPTGLGTFTLYLSYPVLVHPACRP